MRLITTNWQAHKLPIQRIRELIFIKEQSVPEELEWDEYDETSTHYLVLNDKSQAIATARLTTEGQLGRMAVVKQYRRQGIAAKLLSKIIHDAKQKQLDSLRLHAQTYIQPLYKAAGFIPTSEVFSEAGIPHVEMTLYFENKDAAEEITTMQAIEDENIVCEEDRLETNKQNTDDEPFVLSHIDEFIAATLKLAKAARHTIKILTPDLEADLYDHENLISLISAFCRSHRHASVQILISGEPKSISTSHQLVQLAQRIPSSISIKQVKPGHQKPEGAFMIVDRDSIMHRNRTTEYKGFASIKNAAQNRIKTHYFEQYWNHAIVINELRRLGI